MMIQEVKQVTEQHYDLLGEADPSRRLVENYLQRGRLVEALEKNTLVGVLVLLPTRPETIEIVNLAVNPEYRRQGIAQQLIHEAMDYAKKMNFRTIEVGTGSTGIEQLYLYQKCGFRMVQIDRDFFVRHYDRPIVENGLVLRDMVRLSQDI